MMPFTNGGIEKECSRCGMERSEWGSQSGYKTQGALFCCAGCAENLGCTCGGEDRPGELPGGYIGL